MKTNNPPKQTKTRDPGISTLIPNILADGGLLGIRGQSLWVLPAQAFSFSSLRSMMAFEYLHTDLNMLTLCSCLG